MVTTAERILDTAQALAQVRGYNGFSYADISAELAITKPSIHYHFPSKAQLAEALVARYRRQFAADAASLPPEVRGATAAFFDDQQRWVAAVFAEAGLPAARARGAAQAFLAALEGALLLARASAPGAADEAPGSHPGDGVVLGVAVTMLDALL
jgi:TetR/AcrR family transcriptional repressor of nem operon